MVELASVKYTNYERGMSRNVDRFERNEAFNGQRTKRTRPTGKIIMFGGKRCRLDVIVVLEGERFFRVGDNTAPLVGSEGEGRPARRHIIVRAQARAPALSIMVFMSMVGNQSVANTI